MQFHLSEFSKSNKNKISVTAEFSDQNLFLLYDLSTIELNLSPASFYEFERANNLWQNNCLECFLGNKNSSEYIELNFSLNGLWNCYSFSSYRQSMKECLEFTPSKLIIENNILEVSIKAQNTFNLNLMNPCCVIEESKHFTFWATQHPAKQPDFHKQKHWINIP